MTRNETFTRLMLAYADLGWAVPTGIEGAPMHLLSDSLVLAETIRDTRNEVRGTR